MTTDRATVLSLTLTFLLIASAVPAGDLGFAGTAAANHHGGDTFTLRQPTVDRCYEVNTFTNDHEKMVPEVEKRGTNDYGDVTGPYRDPAWDGFETIESIMDYRYRYNPDGEGAVGQTDYYAPYLNDQYRVEGWEDGTYGMYNWSDNNDSHLWFYENANGEVSLVVRHDKLYENVGTVSHGKYNGVNGPYPGFFERSPGSGSASFEFITEGDAVGLPEGEWAYIDDMYPKEGLDDYYTDGEVRYGHREAEYDATPLGEFEGGYFSIDWSWDAWSTDEIVKHGTDGGAYRGFHNLDSGESVTITNSFSGDVEEWEFRTNDGSRNGVQQDLVMGEPLTIERGANCLDASVSASPDPVEAGQNVTFSAPPGADEYRWDFDGDGQPESETDEDTVRHAYDSAGDRQVSVTIVSDGETTSGSTTVEVGADESPTAAFSVEDGVGDADHHVVGESIRFDGSESSDNVALAGEYEWSIDGTPQTGERVNATFSSPGDKQVSLTVTDRSGKTDTVNRTVTIVAEDDPEARASASPSQVEAGAPVTFDGTASSDDHGEIVSHEWDLDGDGETDERGPLLRAPYDEPGTKNVTLTVTDNNGNADTANRTVSVFEASDPSIASLDVPPNASVTGSVEVSANATDESNVTYTWTFSGGGNPAEKPGRQVTHSFDDQGTATVELVVEDAAGLTNSTSATINVTGKPNAALSADPSDAGVDETVTLDASDSSDDGTIAEYDWDLDGDGAFERNATENATVTTTYGASGTYDATVRVVDDDGSTATATVAVEVESNEQAFDGGGGGGGSASLGPPPVAAETQQVGPNVTEVDVRSARGGETVNADLFESAATAGAGVQFRTLGVNLASDDSHALFRTEASADAPEGVPALGTEAASDSAAGTSAPNETLAYLDLGADYLDAEVENATVEFTVRQSALGEYPAPSDVTAYRYDGEWTRLDAEVVDASGDAYRLAATADGLGTLAVGASRGLAVTDVALANDTVTTGERVAATATVENAGPTARNLTLDFALSGGVVDSAAVEVPAGETRQVILSGSAPTPGTYEAAIEGASAGTLAVEQVDPADLSVADVSLDRSTIAAGESVTITATVENAGGQSGERTLNLTMFGEQVDSETVAVPAGETRQITFAREVDAAGSYEVAVGGEAATLDVTETDGDGDDGLGPNGTGVPGFGVAAAVVALLAAALVARTRS